MPHYLGLPFYVMTNTGGKKMKKIETIEQFEEILNNNKTAFIVKHSLTCPISAAAFDEYKQYADTHKDIDTFYLAVQEARPLSNYIAETFEVRHESPQALLFSDRSVVWNASHGGITVDSLQEASTKA